jgi:putative acetyltransferase
LHASGQAVVALIAEQDGKIVGHILFSPVTIEGGQGGCDAIGLAPMAVLPAWRRRGVDARLVEAGSPCASRFGVRCEYNAPDEAFMALELAPGAFARCSEIARFAPEFGAP